MKSLFAFVMLAGLWVTLAGCSDDDDPGQFRYPLKVGSTWYYTRYWYTGPSSDSLHLDIEEPVTVTVGGVETLGSNGTVIRVEIEVGEGPFVHRGAQYYQNLDDGLRLVGYCNPGAVLASPKARTVLNGHSGLNRILATLDLASLVTCAEPVQTEDDPLMVFSYPWRVGREWQFRDVEGFPLTIRKRIASWRNVEVPAGKYDAYRVDWIYTTGQKVELQDDIASIGLIRRVLRVEDVEITNHQHPDEPLLIDSEDILTLDSVKLK